MLEFEDVMNDIRRKQNLALGMAIAAQVAMFLCAAVSIQY